MYRYRHSHHTVGWCWSVSRQSAKPPVTYHVILRRGDSTVPRHNTTSRWQYRITLYYVAVPRYTTSRRQYRIASYYVAVPRYTTSRRQYRTASYYVAVPRYTTSRWQRTTWILSLHEMRSIINAHLQRKWTAQYSYTVISCNFLF